MDFPTNMAVKKDFGLTRIQSLDALSVTLARVSPYVDRKFYLPTVCSVGDMDERPVQKYPASGGS